MFCNMAAKLIDGKAIAAEIRAALAKDVEGLKASGVTPCLAAVLVGEDTASKAYVGTKEKACATVGMKSVLYTPPSDVSEASLIELIRSLNEDHSVHGILVQLPLPSHIDAGKVIEAVAPEKDVDGFHPLNVGRLVIGLDTFKPCTPAGIVELILRSGLPLAGQHVVIVGRSNIVGKPLMNILVQKGCDATVTLCHSRTWDLEVLTRQADILIAATGQPNLITADMVKPGAAVIDVGINYVDDLTDPRGYRLVGDVDFEAVREVAGAITPVPGGVGPMTVAQLLVNTVKAARRLAGVDPS